jgi:hypothetical protein
MDFEFTNVAARSVKSFAAGFSRLKRQWISFTCVRLRHQQLEYYSLEADGWEKLKHPEKKTFNRFSSVILLLPTTYCSFQQRSFPRHLVSETELAEAVELDIQHWSPWSTQSQFFFSYQLSQQTWLANIWVWDRQTASSWRQQLPYCTHIIPELAWYAASLGGTVSLLIHPEVDYHCYALVNAQAWVERLANASTPQQAQRYWHGWGLPAIQRCWTSQVIENSWHPESYPPQLLPPALVPHPRLLKLTRLPEISDWTNPFSYRRGLTKLLFALVLWMMTDATVLSLQQSDIDSQLQQTRHAANQALQLRQQVKQQQFLFSQLQTLRYQQQLPEYLIAELSSKIPADIWLTSLQLQGDQLDLNGQGQQVVRLLPLLEAIKGVHQVMLLNDVHPDPLNGNELFQIRLVFAQSRS